MTWEKLPPLERPGLRSNCLNCGPQPIELPMDAILAVGFGNVTVLKDGQKVWSGDDPKKEMSSIEEIAAKDPDHDYRIVFLGPLSEPEYQRQDGKWILIRKGMGFA